MPQTVPTEELGDLHPRTEGDHGPYQPPALQQAVALAPFESVEYAVCLYSKKSVVRSSGALGLDSEDDEREARRTQPKQSPTAASLNTQCLSV